MTREQVYRVALAYLADPLFRPGTGENHCRECRQTVKYCDADDGRRLSDKGRCAGAVAREAIAAGNILQHDDEAIADLASHAHGMGQQECASHHHEMIAAAKEEGRREAIALIAEENWSRQQKWCSGVCGKHGEACWSYRPHEGPCTCVRCP